MGRKPSPRIPHRLLRDPGHLLALGLGSGLLPRAPGTWGSLAALPFYFPLQALGMPGYVAVLLVLGLFGVWLCGRTAGALHSHDHPGIVWDEWIGLWIALLPAGLNPWAIVLGFVLFRLLDAGKPWPISWLDRRLQGGLGIMLDDVAAGVLAAALLWLLRPWL